MMHGHGESGSAIVAAKPTNKAEQSAAEPVEPRAEAEGNAIQQSTGRAQSRGTVSQALERIRQAARQMRKENSLRSSTTSASMHSGWRSSRLSAMPPPVSTD